MPAEPQAAPGACLDIHKVDKTILCADGEQKPIEVKRWDESTKVYELSFHPDVPIETFFDTMANMISAKGSKIKKARRGGMMQARPDIPETFEDSWK